MALALAGMLAVPAAHAAPATGASAALEAQLLRATATGPGDVALPGGLQLHLAAGDRFVPRDAGEGLIAALKLNVAGRLLGLVYRAGLDDGSMLVLSHVGGAADRCLRQPGGRPAANGCLVTTAVGADAPASKKETGSETALPYLRMDDGLLADDGSAALATAGEDAAAALVIDGFAVGGLRLADASHLDESPSSLMQAAADAAPQLGLLALAGLTGMVPVLIRRRSAASLGD